MNLPKIYAAKEGFVHKDLKSARVRDASVSAILRVSPSVGLAEAPAPRCRFAVRTMTAQTTGAAR